MTCLQYILNNAYLSGIDAGAIASAAMKRKQASKQASKQVAKPLGLVTQISADFTQIVGMLSHAGERSASPSSKPHEFCHGCQYRHPIGRSPSKKTGCANTPTICDDLRKSASPKSKTFSFPRFSAKPDQKAGCASTPTICGKSARICVTNIPLLTQTSTRINK